MGKIKVRPLSNQASFERFISYLIQLSERLRTCRGMNEMLAYQPFEQLQIIAETFQNSLGNRRHRNNYSQASLSVRN